MKTDSKLKYRYLKTENKSHYHKLKQRIENNDYNNEIKRYKGVVLK